MAYSPALFCEECFSSVIDCECNLFTDQEGNVNNDEVMIIGGIAFNAKGEALTPREQEEFAGDGEPEDWEGSYWAEPRCPETGCQGGTSVYCLECGEDPNVCFCPAPVDWYCGSCGESFEFDPQTNEGEEVEEEYDTSPESLDAVLEEIRSEEVLGCKCEPQVTYYCDKCGVKRKTPQDPWVLIPKKSTPSTLGSKGSKAYGGSTAPSSNYSSKYPASKSHSGTTYGGAYYDDDYGDVWGWSKDRHYNGDGLILPKTGLKVYASSSDDTRKPGEFVPDWGLYLDSCWRPKAWRYEYLYWPDMSIPYDDNVAIEAILEAYERILDGQKVEIGCIGGHGRTGTVLAAMAVIEGDTPEQAMNRVWTTYCKHAIESKVQEWWIKWFYGTLFAPDYVIPEKPTYSKSTTYTYSKGGTTTTGSVGKGGTVKSSTTPKPGTACSQGDHYIYWRDGNNSCPQKETSIPNDNSSTNCRWWNTDASSFEKGQESEATKRYYEKYIADKAEEAKKSEANTKMVAVGDYIVPAPKKGESQHNPDQKGGCNCDTCRYKAWGGSVFLETREEREARIEELNDRAKGQAFGTEEPKVSSYPGNGEELWLNVMQKSGEVLTVRISDDFNPMPPPLNSDKDEVGDTYGDYVFTSTHNWVWQGLAEVPKYMRVVQDYKRKSSTVSLDHAETMVEEGQDDDSIIDPLLDGLPPSEEKPTKRNKRNTKSKSRKNKYTNRRNR